MIKNKGVSPTFVARATAISFLMIIIFGGYSQGYALNTLWVWGDPVATATNIIENQSLVNKSYASFLIEMVCQITSSVLIYLLLKPAGLKVATIMVYLGVAGGTLKTISVLFYIAASFVLTTPAYLNGFTLAQLQVIAYFMLDLKAYVASIGLIFIGASTMLTGYLMVKSTFLPKWLGYMFTIGGLVWMSFLSPHFGFSIFNYTAMISLFGVAAAIFWFLYFGVDEKQWHFKNKEMMY